jgi:hypothetical protein
MAKKIDMDHYKTLTNLQERAKYLLTFKITTKLDIVDLNPVMKAYIGDIGLPVISQANESEADLIERAKAWLTEKAA